MKPLSEYFKNAIEMDSDCYVADFTEYTKRSPVKRGVEISKVPFKDIPKLLPKGLPDNFNYFHLKKSAHGNIRYIAINLEECRFFIKGGINNCECLFESLAECKKPWLMFLEMKYCAEKNTDNWTNKACRQMKETYEKLEKESLLLPDARRVYFVYSSPLNSKEPFASFETTQDEVISFIKEKNIHPLGYNTLLIATASRLQPPKKPI